MKDLKCRVVGQRFSVTRLRLCSYPYILILASLVSCAAHYAFKLDQSLRSLVVTSLTESRNLVILLGHWALHAYGIVAVTELKASNSPLVMVKHLIKDERKLTD